MSTNEDTMQFRVIVIGAGIAGLAAAIALRRQGHIVEIHERSRFKAEVGAGILIAANVTRLFDEFGIQAANLHPVEANMSSYYLPNKVGEPAFSFPPAQLQGDKHYPNYAVHRVDLHNELMRLALGPDGPGHPCQLTLGSAVVDCDPETATVTLANGSTLRADLLVGADGVKSVMRNKICPSALEPKNTGLYACRFTLPIDDTTRNDPELQWILENPNITRIVVSEQGSLRLVTYPIRSAKVLNVAMFCHVSEAPAMKGLDSSASYDSVISNDVLLEIYKNWDETYLQLIRRAAPGSIRAWPLLSMDPPVTWVKGKAVLVGDAAHPIWPYAAQGGAQGLEDGAALGALLPHGTLPEEVTARMKLFENLRKSRCSEMQLTSYTMAVHIPIAQEEKRAMDHFTKALQHNALVAAKEALARNPADSSQEVY